VRTIAGLWRVLVGFVGTMGLLTLWGLFFVVLMVIALYATRFFPLVGRQGRRRD